MAITNGYCTLAQLKGRLGITDDTDDAELENVIEGVSRFIDNDRRRVFYTTTEARYWTPKHSDRLWIDDAVSVSSVEVAISTSLSYVTWDSGDYLTEPFNDTPILKLSVHPSSSRYFVPRLLKSAKITAEWGYASATPNEIQQACILLAQYVWLRKDAPFGVAGMAMLGEVQANPDMMPADVRGLINSVPRRVAH
jgi:hypothetical protein